MKNLMDLNLSQNKLYAIPKFPAPKLFLRRADLSYNDIKEIRDLSDCIGLEYINLEGINYDFFSEHFYNNSLKFKSVIFRK